jgi:hypothetical protein
MYARLFSPTISESYFIFGPRGTGKTSWLRTRFPDAPYFGLEAFLVDYPLAKAYLIYGGERSFSHGKIEVIDVQTFFRKSGQLLS